MQDSCQNRSEAFRLRRPLRIGMRPDPDVRIRTAGRKELHGGDSGAGPRGKPVVRWPVWGVHMATPRRRARWATRLSPCCTPLMQTHSPRRSPPSVTSRVLRAQLAERPTFRLGRSSRASPGLTVSSFAPEGARRYSGKKGEKPIDAWMLSGRMQFRPGE